MPLKVCSKCKQLKLISEFYKREQGRLRSQCKSCVGAYDKRHYEKNKERINQRSRQQTQLVKREVLTYYGNGQCRCVRCGFADLRALTIDHIKGGGTKHTNSLGGRGKWFYRWLQKQGYPQDYQTLCFNCQWIKRAENKEL